MKIMGLLKGGVLLLGKHKSAILSGTAIVTAIGTIVMTVKATAKSVKDIEELKEDKYVQANENLNPEDEGVDKEDIKVTPVEVVKASWKHYIPVAVGVATTVTCIICAHRIDAKRIAAATSALMLSEKMNKELEHKTIEEFGKEKLDQIKEKIFHENPDLDRAYQKGEKPAFRSVLNEETTHPYDKHTWFKDSITGQEILSSRILVERAINSAVKEAQRCGHNVVTLSSWLDFLDGTDSVLGDMLGWDLNYQELDVTYEPDLTQTGDPCLVIHYHDKPKLI